MKGSQTEYNQVTKLVLGRIDEGNLFPTNDLGMLSVIASEEGLFQDGKLDLERASKLIPEITTEIITTTQKELQELHDFFVSKNIEVVRPECVATAQEIITPHFKTTQFPVYCPRDILLNFRNLIIISPNLYQSRIDEAAYYKNILNIEAKEGRMIVYAPRPYLRLTDFDHNADAPQVLNTDSPVFEAANVLIDGEHDAIYYQISHSGNIAGYHWLKQLIGDIYPEVTVYPLYVYNGTHLDTTISILNYDTVALNPERIKDVSLLPEPLRKRKCIYPEITDVTNPMGLSSKWIGMNSFSISPKEIIVDKDQVSYIEQLESIGFDVFPHKYTYCDVLEGGHHCTTSDLRRNETY